MDFHFIELIKITAGITAGVIIGYAFGLFQNAALRRHEALYLQGKLKSGWSLMPGSGQRVACLLLALVLVQLICPLLFVDGTQWVVSGGVILGYGWVLFQQLRRRLNQQAN